MLPRLPVLLLPLALLACSDKAQAPAPAAPAAQAPQASPPSRVERYNEIQKAQGTTSASATKWREAQKARAAAQNAPEAGAPSEAQATPEGVPGEGPAPEGPPPASAIPSEFKLKDERIGSWSFRFESFGVGLYVPQTLPAPFDQPCQTLATSDPLRSIQVFGALDCPQPFPEDSTVALIIGEDPGSAPKEGDKVARFVQAVAMFHGCYFLGRSNFPLCPGYRPADFVTAFGPEKSRFALGDGPQAFTVHHHEGDIFAMVLDGEVEGVVLGPLPTDPADERWQLFLQIYQKHSLKISDLDREIR